jgi:DNA-binding NarL/FixJ family response regulator
VEHAPRVLLGKLEPMLLFGLQRVLAEDGVDVIGQEERAEPMVTSAERLQPDAVVLDLTDGSRILGERIRQVAPATKVILWARDETVMEVLDPGSPTSRLVLGTRTDGVRSELTRSRPRQPVEE